MSTRVPATVDHYFADVKGLRIHYQHRPGPGPTVLLLPGGMLDSSMLTWQPVLDALPDQYDAFSVDFPGYGQSDTPLDAPYTTEYYVQFINDFLDVLAFPPATLMASSMSGAVALWFTLKYPKRVQKLVFSGAYGFQDRVLLHPLARRLAQIPHLHTAFRWWLSRHPIMVRMALPISVYDWRNITDELVHDAYIGVRPPHALLAFQRWLASELLPDGLRSNATPYLEAIRQPTLLLHGTHDWMMPLDYTERAATLLPNAQLHIFERCGHLAPREHPHAVNRLIHAFLGA